MQLKYILLNKKFINPNKNTKKNKFLNIDNKESKDEFTVEVMN